MAPETTALPSRLEGAEDRPPHGVARLGRSELERRVDGQPLAEFFAACAVAPRGGVEEREMLVRAGALLRRRAPVDGALQALGRGGVVAVFVELEAGGERRAFGLHRAEHRPPDGMPRLRGPELERGGGGD